MLKKAESLEEKVLNVFAGFGIIYIWVALISLMFKGLELNLPSFNSIGLAQFFVMAVILSPIWEEVCFRVALLYPTKFLNREFQIPVMVASSVLFGWLHGSVVNVLFQGVMGFVFACVYIKNGYSYWSSVALHFMWNGSIFLQILMK